MAKTLTGASDAFARVVVGPAGDEEEEEEERSLGQTAPLTTQHASTTISGLCFWYSGLRIWEGRLTEAKAVLF